jgi:hypothetical protein
MTVLDMDLLDNNEEEPDPGVEIALGVCDD